jgi:hypothetical protein
MSGQSAPNTAGATPARPGCGTGSTVGSATGTTPQGNLTGTPPLIKDQTVGSNQSTTQEQLKANPMPGPRTGSVGC